MNNFKLRLDSPYDNYYNGEASYLSLPGVEGRLGILVNHVDIIIQLSSGMIHVTSNNNIDSYFISEGYFIMKNNEASVICNKIVLVDDNFNVDNEIADIKKIIDSTSNNNTKDVAVNNLSFLQKLKEE